MHVVFICERKRAGLSRDEGEKKPAVRKYLEIQPIRREKKLVGDLEACAREDSISGVYCVSKIVGEKLMLSCYCDVFYICC